MTTIQELRFAYNNNFYDIVIPPKKTIFFKDSEKELLEQKCLKQIRNKKFIQNIEIGKFTETSDYIHLFFQKEGNFFVDGLVKSNVLQKYKKVNPNIPHDEYVLCKFIKFKTNIKITEEDKKIYYLSKTITTIHRKGFVFYCYETKEFVYQDINIDWYKMKCLEKKIQNYKEFYPTMSMMCLPKDCRPTFYNSDFSFEKVKIGEKYGEISLLPGCGEKICQFFHEKQVYSTKDGKYKKVLNEKIKGKTLERIKRVQFVNSSKYKDWIYINQELYNDNLFQTVEKKYKEEKLIFFDSEYISGKNQYLYGFFHQNETFHYIWNDSDEKKLLDEIVEYWEKYPDYVFIYYDADKGKLKKLFEKTNTPIPKNFFQMTIDMIPFLQDYCAFKGVYNFSMKSIEKVFIEQGYIKDTYEDGICKNGFDSISLFKKYLETKDESIKKDIIEYNRLDCQNQKIILNELLRLK